MRGYNKAIVMGNLTRDPEIRYTQSKAKCAQITVAVGRKWKDKQSGEYKDQTDFIPVALWGTQADVAEKYLKKGSAVLVEGRISVHSYDGKDGQKRVSTEIVADSMQMVGGKAESAERSAQTQRDGFDNGETAQSLRTDSSFDEEFPLDFSGSAENMTIPF